jgi:DNA polymerase-3 subunit delta
MATERGRESGLSIGRRPEKGDASPVYYLYGEDGYRREQALRQLLDTLLPEAARALNLEQIRAGEGNDTSILGAARTLPFLSVRRVVLVRDAEVLSRQQQEELVAYLEDPAPTTCVVLTATRLDLRTRLAAALQKRGTILRFGPLQAGAMREALQEAARDRGKRVTQEALDLLVTLSGDDLRRAMSEVEKASLFVGERAEIGRQDVEVLVGQVRIRSIFRLMDAVSAPDLRRALCCLSDVIGQGEEPMAILGMLARQIRLLIRAKTLGDGGVTAGEIARALGLQPRTAAAVSEQAVSLSWQWLVRALHLLHRTDVAIKTGRTPSSIAIEGLVWEICRA